MSNDRLYARIRQEDDVIREHFSKIKKSDHAYEVRRLIEKAIADERKEKEIIESVMIQREQDS